jgi:hypothetical protein
MTIAETSVAGANPKTASGKTASKRVIEVTGVHDCDTSVRFIPVSRDNVVKKLLELDWSEQGAQAVDDTLYYIGRLRQQHTAVTLDGLMEDYHRFNPDNDMEFTTAVAHEELEEQRERFLNGVETMVFRANFERISRADLEQIVNKTSPYGVDVDVDLDEYEPLLPFFRGTKVNERSERDWRWLYLHKRHLRIHSYERLFLALTLKPKAQRVAEIMSKEGMTEKQAERRFKKLRRALPDWVSTEHVYLKMFKNIPQIDIDMLLPNNGVKFRPFDRLMLWVSGGGSTAYALIVAVLKLVLAVAISPFFMFMTLFGFGGTAFRQFMSVINTRNRYMMELVQKLYFHNISNNQGVLTLLLDEAEEEDIKEDALLYAFLLRQSGTPDLNAAKADVEAFLHGCFGINVDFDHEEALGRLADRQLAGIGVDGRLWVMSAAHAVQHLREQWMGALDLRNRA